MRRIPSIAITRDGQFQFDDELSLGDQPGVGDAVDEVTFETRHCRALRLEPHLLEYLHAPLCDPTVTGLWRTRGRYVPAHELEQLLTEGVADSLVVQDRRTGVLFGLLELMNVDERDRHGQFTAVSWSRGLGRALLVEAITAAIGRWFKIAELEMMYTHVISSERNRAIHNALRRHFSYDGLLRGYVSLSGERFDVCCYSISKDEYSAIVSDARVQRWLSPL